MSLPKYRAMMANTERTVGLVTGVEGAAPVGRYSLEYLQQAIGLAGVFRPAGDIEIATRDGTLLMRPSRTMSGGEWIAIAPRNERSP